MDHQQHDLTEEQLEDFANMMLEKEKLSTNAALKIFGWTVGGTGSAVAVGLVATESVSLSSGAAFGAGIVAAATGPIGWAVVGTAAVVSLGVGVRKYVKDSREVLEDARKKLRSKQGRRLGRAPTKLPEETPTKSQKKIPACTHPGCTRKFGVRSARTRVPHFSPYFSTVYQQRSLCT